MRLLLLLFAVLGAAFAQPLADLPEALSIAALRTGPDGDLYAAGTISSGTPPRSVWVARFSPDGGQLRYSRTFPGGTAVDLVVAADGSAYITGLGGTLGFASANRFGNTEGGGSFVLKLLSSGVTEYVALVGGAESVSIAVNAAGEALMGCRLPSYVGFVLNPTPGTIGAGELGAGCIVKLSARGDRLLLAIVGYGNGPVAFGAGAEIFVAGVDLPGNPIATTPGAFQPRPPISGCGLLGCTHQYVARISADGTRLIYGTYLSGFYGSTPSRIALDRDGSLLVAGTSRSGSHPVTPGAFQSSASTGAGFLSKLNATGTALLWSTFFTGSLGSSITDLEIDTQGDLRIAGLTSSADLPGTQPAPAGCTPRFRRELAFVARFTGTGDFRDSRFVYGLPNSPVRLAGGFVATADSLPPLVALDAPQSLGCFTDPATNIPISRVVPGGLVTVFSLGERFGAEALGYGLGPALPFSLSDVSVSVGGIEAPLLYVSPLQVNFQAPFEIAGRDTVEVRIRNPERTFTRSLRVVASAPAVFLDHRLADPQDGVLTCNGQTVTPALQAFARNEDGTDHTCTSPASPGAVVTFYLHGMGITDPPGVTGRLNSGDAPPLKMPVFSTNLGDGGLVDIEPDPGSVSGLWRMRIRAPRSSARFQVVAGAQKLDLGTFAIWVR